MSVYSNNIQVECETNLSDFEHTGSSEDD